ncbi:hypothetical protein SBDP1_680040 [Syntrophobacter sp. SbD1]|nr:hypothetical protein SBDP1_680040 [Syntrophobacter sp. SbD1]
MFFIAVIGQGAGFRLKSAAAMTERCFPVRSELKTQKSKLF